MKKYLKWIITLGISLIMFVIYLAVHEVFDETDKMELYKQLCNASFVTGGLLAGFGLLVFASNEGTFDIFVYGMQSFINLFRKDRSKMKYETFYDYRLAHAEKKFSFGHIIIIGLIFILIAGFFLYMYYQVQ